MYYIKTCPGCGQKLRFPLDRGAIRIKCTCGISFTVNPDDPATYKNGSFDPVHQPRKRHTFSDRLRKLRRKTGFHDITATIIKNFLQLKYTLQNFRLLPSQEQKRIILITVLALAAILLGILLTATILSRPLSPDGITL